MNDSVSILITGSEILDGRVQDTNSHLIISRLTDAGLSIGRTVGCGDSMQELHDSLQFLMRHSKFIILSGGMGPTADDLTREFLAQSAGVSLELDQIVLENLKSLYVKRQRVFDETNIKQAYFPKDAQVIPNPIGTAAGFVCQINNCYVYALPGVPQELKLMLEETALPSLIHKIFGQTATALVRPKKELRVFGLPESVVGQKVVASGPPKELLISYRAAFPEVHVILKAPQYEYPISKLNSAYEAAVTSLGADYIINSDLSVSFEEVMHKLLLEKKLTLGVAESCTGGMLGGIICNTPGSSSYFLGGAITYSNSLKNSLINVPETLIEKHGAVSFEVAKSMAQGVRDRCKSDLALSITGIAGPDGGSEEKPVGTFYVGYSDESGSVSYKCFLSSSRGRIRKFAAYTALDILRRKLLNFAISFASNIR